MSDSIPDFLKEFMGGTNQEAPYYCNKCHSALEKEVVQTIFETPRKLFYCKNPKCIHFGLITVVAKRA